MIASKSTKWSAFVLACISSVEFVSYTNQGSTGTKMPRTNWKTMGDYQVCLPAASVVRAFQNTMQPVLEQIIANVHESRTLATLRDTLLPKLISGEIRLRDAARKTRNLVGEIKERHDEAESLVKGITAEAVHNDPDETERAAENVRGDPTASTISQAVAAAILLQQQGNIDKAVEKWRTIANVVDGTDTETGARAWFSVGYLHQSLQQPGCCKEQSRSS